MKINFSSGLQSIFTLGMVLICVMGFFAIIGSGGGGGGDDNNDVYPDPAVQNILFEIINQTSAFRGRVRITGVVRNVGGPYLSSDGQQSVALYEIPLGGSLPPTPTSSQAYKDLGSGNEVRVTFERNWDSSSPSEGEFPPDYRVMLMYDPDISADGNERNDDCVSTNNMLEESGSGINDLFGE